MGRAPEPPSPRKLPLALVALALCVAALTPPQAKALSELRAAPDEQRSAPEVGSEAPSGIPLPDPLINRSVTTQTDSANEDADAMGVEIIRDLSQLPEPVKRMRELIVEAAASGSYERLRPLTDSGSRPTQVPGDIADAIESIKSFSGDPDGLEILAIILDILSTGAARLDVGTPDEVYVWPYFVGKPLGSLTPPERVELLRIITFGDLMGMEEGGNYNFYRLAITPEGEWTSFTGGD
ncbi:hypothetical protein [Rhizobium halophilum]|uniref:hypothetical protein n=1 Tax=Rhizobium halophilum TaxID=2846852 RepID=UPI001EFEE840|nr:hypothetical protein [Rhizobium halophilum]MCF6370638.1 hypothetical protein [Rhizobium halophilum]